MWRLCGADRVLIELSSETLSKSNKWLFRTQSRSYFFRSVSVEASLTAEIHAAFSCAFTTLFI